MNIPLRRQQKSFALITLVSLAAACSPPAAVTQGASTDQPARQFGAEEKRAARALSIGNDPALVGDATPYDRALRCSIAFEALAKKFVEAGSGSGPQLRAIGQARALFDRRAGTLARQANRTTAEMAGDRAKQAEAFPEGPERARAAIGCIRQLQQETAA